MTIIHYSDWVIFRNQKGKEWLRSIQKGKSLHTHRGFINFDDIVGRPFGSIVKTLNDKILLMIPRPAQLTRNMTNKTNIIYEGDAVAMLSSAGVGPGDKVLEIGTGSGGFTLYLSYYIVRNTINGIIVSVDVNSDHSATAKANLEKFNLFKEEQIEFRSGDVDEVLHEVAFFDAAFIDMATPWEVLEKVKTNIKNGASILIFLPNWYQVEETIAKAKQLDFTVLDVFETNRRPMDVNPAKHIMRPRFRSIVYSGMLIHLIKSISS